jgi:amino acid transporter
MTQTALPPRVLKRSMRVVGALLLTLSAITPASSVFVIVPGVFQDAGTGAFLSMATTAVLSLAVALVYAELSSAYPIAGGEYSMIGRILGPGSAFAVLALTAIGNMLAPAVLALGAAVYIGVLVPGLNPVAVGIAIIAVTTLFGILHIRTNAWVTGVFLALELLALAVLAALGFGHIERPLTALVAHPVALDGGILHPTPVMMIVLSTAVSVFAYNGYGAAVYFSEEMHDAPRLIARTIILALLITVATELIPVTAVLLGAPDLHTLFASESPFSDFVLRRGGPVLNVAVSLAIALAIVNAVLATVLQNGRFFFSTGRDATWHDWINDAFTRTHPRFNSPWIATLASGASAAAMCFVGLQLLLVLTGTGLVIVYAVICIAALAGRFNRTSAHAPYRMPLFPLVPLLGLIALCYILYASWLDPDTGRPSLIANGCVIVVSVIYYRFVLLRRGAWQLSAPQDQRPP